MIGFKDGVTGSLNYGRNSYDFNEGLLIFLGPNQVFAPNNISISPDSKGWTLLFHPDLIRRSKLGAEIEEYSFFSYDLHESLHISEKEKVSLNELVSKIEEECHQNLDRHSHDLIVTNLELALKYCKRFYDRQFYTRTNLNKDHISKFNAILKDYFKTEKNRELGLPTVKYLSLEMNMSSSYLSDILKKETGKNAQEHIYIFMIEKAKTLLLASVEPISQIAYELGFEYPQHFTKLFKSKVGISPVEYRKLN